MGYLVSRIFRERIILWIIFISGGFFLFISLWGGLWRIGWNSPQLIPGLPGIHGPLIICGFLGTFFGLERTMTLKDPWGYLVPILIIVGSASLLINPMGSLSRYLILAGSMGFSFICFLILFRNTNLYHLMIFGGSALWLTGIIIWIAGWPVFNVYLWWMGSVLFTMVGQRLELAHRLKLPPKAFQILAIGLGVVFFGQVLMALGHVQQPDYVMDSVLDSIRDPRLKIGMRVSGGGMILTALWLLRHDPCWFLFSNQGTSRYTGICLLSGYVWLGMSGIFSLVFATLVSGQRYDALIHSFFIGFVWFFIFGHSPSIFLSAFGFRLKKMGFFFLTIFLLHGTLIMRIVGDLIRNRTLQKWGGLLNGVVIVLFIVSICCFILHERFKKKSTKMIN
ncbi:hypothetical protein BVX98_01560 [bacterium F11]|nr:hypothetical protein BVX98_01560 [bacterium F11]